MKKNELIKMKLKEKLMTVRELADLIEINEVSMSRYLSGDRAMSDELADRCLKVIEEVNNG